MEYQAIRKKFVEMSGRYDLVKTDWNDNGADFFINLGQRFLDRMTRHRKAEAKYITDVDSDTWVVPIENCRAVNEVYVRGSSGTIVKLDKYKYRDFRVYLGELVGDLGSGTPAYYAVVNLRGYPDESEDFGDYVDTEDIHQTWDGENTHYSRIGVIIYPKPSESLELSVYGLFYSPTLSAVYADGAWTQTASYWTSEHPDALLYAALYKMETFYRNTEGSKDWLGVLQLEINTYDFDLVEEDMADIDCMEG